MSSKKIVRWLPIITIALCLFLVATVVSAEAYGQQKKGWGPGQGMRGGPGGPGMHQGRGGPGMGQFQRPEGLDIVGKIIGPGGPFADKEAYDLMAEIKILGFFNKFGLSEDQLREIASLSYDTREMMEDAVVEIRNHLIPKLEDRRDALLRGEKPEEKFRGEKPEISEDHKQMIMETKEALEGAVDAFFELLTEDQAAMLKGMGGSRFGPGRPIEQDPHRPRMEPGPRFGGEWGRQPERSGREKPGYWMENPGEGEGQFDATEYQEKPRRKYDEGFRPGDGDKFGPHHRFGPQQGFGQHNMDGGMRMKMRIIGLLLDPRTADIAREKIRYL